jgi:hypothetical protein
MDRHTSAKSRLAPEPLAKPEAQVARQRFPDVSFGETKAMTSTAGARPGMNNRARRAHRAQPEWMIGRTAYRNYSGQQCILKQHRSSDSKTMCQ